MNLEDRVIKVGWLFALTISVLALPSQGQSQQLEYFGKPVRGIPVSSAVKVGKLVFVSGTPGYKR
jgi:enamine deaminase RidA (YjgF/YER057c/UK114 family)